MIKSIIIAAIEYRPSEMACSNYVKYFHLNFTVDIYFSPNSLPCSIDNTHNFFL